jgi:hypothetical protein
MVKSICLLSLIVFCGLPLPAFDDQSEVQQVDKTLQAVINARDTATLATLLTDDFQFIARRGNVSDKTTYLGSLKAGKALADVRNEIIKIRVYRDSAIVTLKSTSPSAGADEAWYLIRVFVKQAGAWKLASMQATLIAPAR